MIFINNDKPTVIYAKVWNVDRHEKYTDLRVSTSEKQQDGTYENSTWFPRLIGHAHQKLKDLKNEDRIVITKAKLTNPPYTDDKGNKKSYLKFLVLEAEMEGESASSPEKSDGAETNGEMAEGEMPW